MTSADWIALGIGVPTALLTLAGFIKKSVIPASTAERLREDIERLQRDNDTCQREQAKLREQVQQQANQLAQLESIINTLRGSEDWWQHRCRQLQDENDRLQRRAVFRGRSRKGDDEASE